MLVLTAIRRALFTPHACWNVEPSPMSIVLNSPVVLSM
jgi:hypothetical protein